MKLRNLGGGNVSKQLAQWNSGTTRESNPGPRARIPSALTTKAGFPSTTQRKERHEMTSLLDRPITAASDDGVSRWHAAKPWQPHVIKYEIIVIKFDLRHKVDNK